MTNASYADGLGGEVYSPCFNSGDIEHVVDQLKQVAFSAMDLLKTLISVFT